MPLTKEPMRGALLCLLFAGASLLPWLLFTLSTIIFTGAAPDYASYFSGMRLIAHQVQIGYTGLPYVFDPVAAVMVVHACYCLLKLSLRANQSFVFQDAYRAAICTMILIWFAYYINRPHITYLSGELMLYGLLVIDLVRTLIIQLKRPVAKRFEPAVVPALLLAVVVLPEIFFGFEYALPSYLSGVKQRIYGPEVQPAVKVSGVMVQPAIAQELVSKAKYVKLRSEQGPVLYLTSDHVFVPKLSGVLTAAKFADPVQEIVFDYQLAAFTKLLTAKGPAYILFDDPRSLTRGASFEQACFSEIKYGIRQSYQPSARKWGWEIWTRKQSR